ncbi:hypothetical protein Tco_0163084 [Tanacetum coccineum]
MIHKAVASLKSKGVNLLGFCKKVIGNGNNSNFWYDKWLGDICFKVKFNRLFNLDLQKDASVAQKFKNPDFVDVPCVLCPNYGNVVESHNHLFFGCLMALDLFCLLGRWWNIDIINLIDPFSWESWFNGLQLNNLKKLALEASFFSMWWPI